ncbi:MAG: HAMP domain-containing histidine kinase [Bacteroidetes bacterium]|nr:HAMP domain-containing histidine kinase [Bacteroidota bacterium]
MSDQPDYDELLEYTKQLEAKVSRLEDALRQYQSDGTRVKTRFLSNISHEIRTPMNAIIGFSHLLGEDDVEGDQRDSYINHITKNSNSLLNMMDNLIDMTLIETGALQLKDETVEVYPMIKELYDQYNLDRYRVNRDRIAFLLNVRETFKEAKIISDKERLSRALSCLLDNAFTQTKKGVVELGVTFAGKNTLVFTVKDSSSMLLQGRARKVFETDVKEEDWYNTSDVIGLGYKLARGMAEAMGGYVILSDSSFKGMSIEFSIPVRTVTPKYYQTGNTLGLLTEKGKKREM